MFRMKATDLKGKTVNELRDMLNSLRQESFNLRIQKSSGQLENTAKIKNVRRDIARIKTFITQLSK